MEIIILCFILLILVAALICIHSIVKNTKYGGMFEEAEEAEESEEAIMAEFEKGNTALIKKINFTRGKLMFSFNIENYDKLLFTTFNKLQKDENIAYIIIELIKLLGEDIKIEQVKLIILTLIFKLFNKNIYNILKIIFDTNRDIFNKIIIIIKNNNMHTLFFTHIIPLAMNSHIYIPKSKSNDKLLDNCIDIATTTIAYENIWILLYFTFKLYDEIFKQFKDFIMQYMRLSNLNYTLLNDNYSNFLIMAILSNNIDNVQYIIDNFPAQLHTLIVLPDSYGFNAISWAAYGSSNIDIFNLIYIESSRYIPIPEEFKLPIHIEDRNPNTLYIGSIVECKAFNDGYCADIFEKIKIIFTLMIEESDARYRYSNNIAFICLKKESDYFRIGLLSDIIFKEIKKYIDIENNYRFLNIENYNKYFEFIQKLPIFSNIIHVNELQIYRPIKIYNMKYITQLDVKNSNAYFIHAHGSQTNMENFINLQDNVYIIMPCKPFADLIYNYITELYNFYLKSKNKLSFIKNITSINTHGNRFCIFEKKCPNISLSFTGEIVDNIDIVDSISYGIYTLPIEFDPDPTLSIDTKELLTETYKNVSSSEQSTEEKTIAEKQIADFLKSKYTITSAHLTEEAQLDTISDLNTLLETIIYPTIMPSEVPCIIVLNVCRS
jgi:hypothetical protein